MVDIRRVKELIKKGDIDEAIRQAKSYYEATKDDKVYNLYGIALMKKGEFAEAEKVFEHLYSKYQDNSKILMNYSQVLINLRQIEKAERILREGAMLFPEEEKIYELINVCEAKKREMEQRAKESEEKKVEEEKELLEEEKKEELVKEGEKGEEELGAEEEMRRSKSDEEELIEKIEEIKEEMREEEERVIRRKKEEVVDYIIEREKISLEEMEDSRGEFLKRGRVLEVSLSGGSEIVLRETFIIFISGVYKVFPLKVREEGKIKEDFFGGTNHKFLRLRGERCLIGVQADYISVMDVSQYGKLYILEPYLIGFDAFMKYDSRDIKVKGMGPLKIVELDGAGKVIIFTGGKKIMKKEYDDVVRISLPNFVAACGEAKITFLDGSMEIKGGRLSLIKL